MIIPTLFAQAQGAVGGSSQLMVFVVEVGAIIAIFYFIVLKPQAKERKKVEEARLLVKRGDEIMTVGGVLGEVVHVAVGTEGGESTPKMEDRVTIRSGESKLVIERASISRITPKAT